MKYETDNIMYEIVEHIATLEEFSSGWTMEFNIVKWNGGEAKYDIRPWSGDHKKMGRGITLFEYEMKKVVEAYLERSKR